MVKIIRKSLNHIYTNYYRRVSRSFKDPFNKELKFSALLDAFRGISKIIIGFKCILNGTIVLWKYPTMSLQTISQKHHRSTLVHTLSELEQAAYCLRCRPNWSSGKREEDTLLQRFWFRAEQRKKIDCKPNKVQSVKAGILCVVVAVPSKYIPYLGFPFDPLKWWRKLCGETADCFRIVRGVTSFLRPSRVKLATSATVEK